MKVNKEALFARLKEKTTWLGLAGIVVSLLGLAPGTEEQIALLIASLIPIIYDPTK